jgi:hypothetical protein
MSSRTTLHRKATEHVMSNGNGYEPEREHRFLDPKKGPAVAVGKCYERRNARGQQFFQGRLGDAKVMIVPTGERNRGEPVWAIVLAEGPYPIEGAVDLARELEQAEGAR